MAVELQQLRIRQLIGCLPKVQTKRTEKIIVWLVKALTGREKGNFLEIEKKTKKSIYQNCQFFKIELQKIITGK